MKNIRNSFIVFNEIWRYEFLPPFHVWKDEMDIIPVTVLIRPPLESAISPITLTVWLRNAGPGVRSKLLLSDPLMAHFFALLSDCDSDPAEIIKLRKQHMDSLQANNLPGSWIGHELAISIADQKCGSIISKMLEQVIESIPVRYYYLLEMIEHGYPVAEVVEIPDGIPAWECRHAELRYQLKMLPSRYPVAETMAELVMELTISSATTATQQFQISAYTDEILGSVYFGPYECAKLFSNIIPGFGLTKPNLEMLDIMFRLCAGEDGQENCYVFDTPQLSIWPHSIRPVYDVEDFDEEALADILGIGFEPTAARVIARLLRNCYGTPPEASTFDTTDMTTYLGFAPDTMRIWTKDRKYLIHLNRLIAGKQMDGTIAGSLIGTMKSFRKDGLTIGFKFYIRNYRPNSGPQQLKLWFTEEDLIESITSADADPMFQDANRKSLQIMFRAIMASEMTRNEPVVSLKLPGMSDSDETPNLYSVDLLQTKIGTKLLGFCMDADTVKQYQEMLQLLNMIGVSTHLDSIR